MKNENSTLNIKKLLESQNQKLNLNSISKLKCPICKINNPLILNVKKDYTNHSFIIQFSCECINSPQEISLDKFYEILSTNEIKNNYKCYKHLEKEATEYCENCQKFFCDICESYHKDLVNGHKTIPSKFINDLNICKKHNNGKKITLYCEKCDKGLCSLCDLVKHTEHNIISIKEYWNKIYDKLKFNSTVELEKKLNNEKTNFESVIATSLEKITYLTNKLDKLRGLIFDFYYLSNRSNEIFSQFILSSFNEFFNSKDCPNFNNIHNCENLMPCNLVSYEECSELETIFNGFLNLFNALTICESSIIQKDFIKIQEILNSTVKNNLNYNLNYNLKKTNDITNINNTSNNNTNNTNNNTNDNDINTNDNTNNNTNDNDINTNDNNINNTNNNKEVTETSNSITNGEFISTQSSLKRENEIIKLGNNLLNKKKKSDIPMKLENKNTKKPNHIFKIPITEIKKTNEISKNKNNNSINDINNNKKNNEINSSNHNAINQTINNNKSEDTKNLSKNILTDKKDIFTLDTVISKKYIDSHSNDFLETFSLNSLQENYDCIHGGNDSIKVLNGKKKKSEETNETNINTITVNDNNEQINKNENGFYDSIFYNRLDEEKVGKDSSSLG